MNLGELRALFRGHLLDRSLTNPFFSDAEIDEFANDAVMEAVRRGFLLLDSTTTDICELPYTAGNPVVPLDPRVINIRDAIVRGQVVPLERVPVKRMEALWPGWRATTSTMPTIYIPDLDSASLRLYPSPTVAGVVDITVAREPLGLMRTDVSRPEMPARYHRSLLQWMLYRGYSKQDTEVFDKDRAKLAHAEFVREFGERKSARNEKWAAEQSPLYSDTLA